MSSQIQIVEVGPRDGLQNEKQILATADKVALIDQLSASGLTAIEIGSFVRPDWIPPLADTDQVAAQIQRRPGVSYSALVPNQRGLQRALEAQLNEVAIFMSVTESHNRSNTNRSIADSLAAYRPLIAEATRAGLRVRAYLSTVFGCPFEGAVAPDAALPLVESLLDMGAYQISLGDTIGVATPNGVQAVLNALLPQVGAQPLALHFHDTRGTALANVLQGWQMGIRVFDSALGGLGGCPYAPSATGNLSTEDMLYMFQGMGLATEIDLAGLVKANHRLSQIFARELHSKYALTIVSLM